MEAQHIWCLSVQVLYESRIMDACLFVCLLLLLLYLHCSTWCHRSVGFVIGETDISDTLNKSFLPTEQCLQDQGEVRGTGNYLSCAGR